MPAKSYLRQHWLGRHSVVHSFWINLILPIATLLTIQSLAIPGLIQRHTISAVNATIALTLIYVIILVWQCVGVTRASRFATQSGAAPIDSWVINASIIAIILLITVRLIDTLSSTQAEALALIESRGRPIDDAGIGLTITLSTDLRVATISGTLRPGATRLVKEMLEHQKSVTRLVFDSNGGSIFEGRGIGNLAKQRSLETHVQHQCLSACTLAFAGGTKRSAADNAVLGFHAYRMDAQYNAAWLDVDRQQEKDQAWLAQQGVSSAFTEKVFHYGSENLWTPDRTEMLNAGFLTE